MKCFEEEMEVIVKIDDRWFGVIVDYDDAEIAWNLFCFRLSLGLQPPPSAVFFKFHNRALDIKSPRLRHRIFKKKSNLLKLTRQG